MRGCLFVVEERCTAVVCKMKKSDTQLLDTDNKEFQDALQLIAYTRQSVFLTGKAGTGKSTFLKYLFEY